MQFAIKETHSDSQGYATHYLNFIKHGVSIFRCFELSIQNHTINTQSWTNRKGKKIILSTAEI